MNKAVFERVASFAVAAAVLAAVVANALDANREPYIYTAFSSLTTFLHLCGGDAAILSDKACKDGSYAQHAEALESALQDALEKAPANIRPLLKRDQDWFGETGLNTTPRDILPLFRQRIVTLARITNGLTG